MISASQNTDYAIQSLCVDLCVPNRLKSIGQSNYQCSVHQSAWQPIERSGPMAEDFSLSWNLESLNKAYKQGYMSGVMGKTREDRPGMSDVVLAAWEAGWEDGNDVAIQDTPNVVRLAS